jgi:putative nucleotidyltransferase with HDIG domain
MTGRDVSRSPAKRPSTVVLVVHAAALVAAAVVAAITAGSSHWDLGLLVVLIVCASVSDLAALDTASSRMKVSGSFLSLILAMVLLGGPQAAIVGVVSIAVGWLRWRYSTGGLLNNLVAYAWFPLLGGLGFHEAREAAGLDSGDVSFYLLVVAVFVVALGLNFLFVAGYQCYVDRTPFFAKVRETLVPVLSSELFSAVLAALIVFLYYQVGLAVIVLFAVVLGTFQYLLGELLKSEERGRELDRSNRELGQRTKQLASFQVGLLSAMLHTLDLRDRMTARHSAAVAHYSREIARAAGFTAADQELVHTAGLLHDIGKFIFPDSILRGDGELSPADWSIIRSHPYEGARIVSHIRGYGPVSEIILSHHERYDGKGYPRGIRGGEIPALSRIISVADTYDVMTARDSYREPVSSMEAIQELQRVAGTQLDARFVRLFVDLLAGKDLRYRHGEDADFDAELQLERRVMDYASGRAAGAL